MAQVRSLAQKLGITEIIQNKDNIIFYTDAPDMQKLGKLNAAMDGRISLDLMGRASFKIAPEKNEKPLPLIKRIITVLSAGGNA